MKSRLTDLAACGLESFTFAGISFPKHVWTLPKGTLRERLKARQSGCTGDYYHSPKPVGPGEREIGFYLESDDMPGMRWKFCDQIDGAGRYGRRIDHTGWFTTDEGYGDTMRGIVFRLPHGRGFLAGWSMGEGMSTCLALSIIADEVDAARRADQLAERAAESERDYQADQDRLEREAEVEREEAAASLEKTAADYYSL